MCPRKPVSIDTFIFWNEPLSNYIVNRIYLPTSSVPDVSDCQDKPRRQRAQNPQNQEGGRPQGLDGIQFSNTGSPGRPQAQYEDRDENEYALANKRAASTAADRAPKRRVPCGSPYPGQQDSRQGNTESERLGQQPLRQQGAPQGPSRQPEYEENGRRSAPTTSSRNPWRRCCTSSTWAFIQPSQSAAITCAKMSLSQTIWECPRIRHDLMNFITLWMDSHRTLPMHTRAVPAADLLD